jgi:N-acetylglucosaminyldiphosphoundecaprenol N-acetyl-beta-D-mannosaminyltransferase
VDASPEATSAATSSPRLWVAGLPVVRAGIDSALEMLWDDTAARRSPVYVLVNGYSATLRRQPAYAAVLSSDAVVPLADGAAMTYGAAVTGSGAIGRCPGPDLFEAAADRAAADGTTFFLLGGHDGVAEQLADRLVERHPGLVVAGTATPPFGTWSDEDSVALVDRFKASGADILWLGVSAPKQESWAVRWREQIGRPTVCVGAAFDFLSGNKKRAPEWMRSLGLEWLFRLGSEPGRLWKRYIVGNAVFLGDLARYGGRAPGAAPGARGSSSGEVAE